MLEYDLKLNIKSNENIENRINLLDEDLHLKVKEIDFYKERIRNMDENNNEEQFKIFENEINNIRDMLKEKTLEFLMIENKNKKSHEELSKNYSKIKENLEHLKDENFKYVEALNNISINLDKNNSLNKISEIISKMNLNKSDINSVKNGIEECTSQEKTNDLNAYTINLKENRLNRLDKPSYTIQDENLIPPLNFDESILKEFTNKKEIDFSSKVLNEFDKVFNNELRRIEKHYKKSDKSSSVNLPSKRTSLSQRRSSTDKNYVEWKIKSTNVTFSQTLRSSFNDNNNNKRLDSGNKGILSTNNSFLLDPINSQQSNDNINSLVNQAKERIRNSITNDRLRLSRSANINSKDNFSFNHSLNLSNSSTAKRFNERDNSSSVHILNLSNSPTKRNERDISLNKSYVYNNSKSNQSQRGYSYKAASIKLQRFINKENGGGE